MQSLDRSTVVNASLEEVWDFFSNPANLNRITPPNMSFEIQTDLTGVRMYAGMIIQYKVRPVANIPMRWTTEITQAEDHRFFVDEQRFGPYRFWHHQHHFESLDEHRTTMRDILHYKVGYGPVGALMNRLYIQNRLEEIFDYRAQAIAEIFPAPKYQEALS